MKTVAKRLLGRSPWSARRAGSWWPRLREAADLEPPLARAERLGRVAAERGFDWPDAVGPRQKIEEELRELDQAIARGDRDAIAHELGDVLFSVVNLGRHLPAGDVATCMDRANDRFAQRFSYVEEQLLDHGGHADLAQLERWWNEAKEAER